MKQLKLLIRYLFCWHKWEPLGEDDFWGIGIWCSKCELIYWENNGINDAPPTDR